MPAGCTIDTPVHKMCRFEVLADVIACLIFISGVQCFRRSAQARRPGRQVRVHIPPCFPGQRLLVLRACGGIKRRFHPPQAVTEVRAADADAASAATGNRGPPSLLVRVASAFMYIVPWIDILGMGREVYHFFHNALLLYLLPGACAAAHSWRLLEHALGTAEAQWTNAMRQPCDTGSNAELQRCYHAEIIRSSERPRGLPRMLHGQAQTLCTAGVHEA